MKNLREVPRAKNFTVIWTTKRNPRHRSQPGLEKM